MKPDQLAQLHVPPGVRVEAVAIEGTLIGTLLRVAEHNFRRGPIEISFFRAKDGGLDCRFVRSRECDIILIGELDIRIRALQYDTINSMLRGDLDPADLRSVQARLAAEYCRYHQPKQVAGFLAQTRLVHTPPAIRDLESGEPNERFVGLWALPVLHEIGHWFAAGAVSDPDAVKAHRLLADHNLDAAIQHLATDPETSKWIDGFDTDGLHDKDLVEEGLADTMMSDVLFEVWMNHFGGVNWGVTSAPSTMSIDLAQAFMVPIADQLMIWHMSVEWRIQIENTLGVLSATEASRRLVLLELRRETITRDYAQYLADPDRLGSVGYTYETLREQLDARAKQRIQTLRGSLSDTLAYVSEHPNDSHPAPEVIAAFYKSSAPPDHATTPHA